MTLYWHRWRTRRYGVFYYLSTHPWAGDETTRQLTGEIAGVRRIPSSGRWQYDVMAIGVMPGTWGYVGSPTRARRLVEEYLYRERGAAFGEDTLTFVPAAP